MIDLLTLQRPLDAARVKVARAEEHIRELERDVRTYLSTQPYDLSQPADAKGSAHIHVMPPARLSAIAGDCISNLRVSLDLTFWTLALETGPKDPDRERIFSQSSRMSRNFRPRCLGLPATSPQRPPR